MNTGIESVARLITDIVKEKGSVEGFDAAQDVWFARYTRDWVGFKLVRDMLKKL